MATAESVVRPSEAQTSGRVTLWTWLRFLFGGREAILEIARCPQALWLGLVFVLATGFAREYDGADLRSEPWHLALPLVASLGTSLILWSLVYLAANRRGLEELGFWAGYRTLLTFYWWTAPLAWLYAIPVERLMTPGDATATNFYILAIVSVWRVLLITRSLAVWLNAKFFAMFFLVALFADTVAGILAFASPLPIFNIMGGVRHSEVDRVVLDALLITRFLGVVSWPVWLIGAIVVLVRTSPWSSPDERTNVERVSAWLWAFVAALVVAGAALLPLGQTQQQHASAAARLLHANEIAAAVEYMGKFQRSDLPPIWDPPPRTGYGETKPDVLDVLEEIGRQDAPGWLATVYVEKFNIDPSGEFRAAIPYDQEKKVDNVRIERLLSVFEQHVPIESLDQWEREELMRLAKEERVDAGLRDRMRAYLGSWATGEAPESDSADTR